MSYSVIRDLGSGMNYRKKGLQELLGLILHRRTERLVITHKDRLLSWCSRCASCRALKS